jgi:hypothetical protein
MTVAQRRRLKKQIMRNRVTPGTDLSALRYFAGLLTDQRSLMCVMAGVAMINTGNALISRSSLQFVAGVVAAALFVLGVGQAIRESGRAAVFLRDHRHPVIDPSTCRTIGSGQASGGGSGSMRR